MAKKQIIKRKRSIWVPLTVTLLGATTIVSTGLAVYFALRQGKSATYTITVNLDQDEYIYGGETQKMLQGSLIGQIPTPYKDASTNLIFDHWQEAVTNVDLDPQQPIDHNMTIKAVYKQAVDAVTVTLNYGTGGHLPGKTAESESILVKKGCKVGELPTPIKTNYMFTKWAEKDFGDDINDPITLTATYNPVSGNYIQGGNLVIGAKTQKSGQDTKQWKLYNSAGTEITQGTKTWKIDVVDSQSAPVTNIFSMTTTGYVQWTADVVKGSYIGTITCTCDGAVSAPAQISIEVTDVEYTISGDTYIETQEDESSTNEHEYKLLADGSPIQTADMLEWSLEDAPTGISLSPQGPSPAAQEVILYWGSGVIKAGVYNFKIKAMRQGYAETYTLPVTFVCNSVDCRISSAPSGNIEKYNDFISDKLSDTPFQMTLGTSIEPLEDQYVDWTIDQASQDAGIEIKYDIDTSKWYLYAKDTGVKEGSHLVTVTGKYDMDWMNIEKTASVCVNVVSKEHSYTISGGSKYIETIKDTAGTDTGNEWKIYQDGGTEVFTPASSTWSVTNLDGSEQTDVTITDGIVSWPNSLTVGQHQYLVNVSVVSKAGVTAVKASYPITINVVDHTYTFAGGSTRLSKKDGEGGYDSNAWVLKEDNNTVAYTDLTSLTVTDTSGTAITGVTEDIKADGIVRWDGTLAKGQYDLKITAVYKGNSYVGYASLIVTDADYALTGGATTITTNSTAEETGTGTTKWAMSKNGTAFTPAKYEVDGGPTETTEVYFKVATDGTVTWKNIPAGTYNMTLLAYDAAGDVVASTGITLVSTETFEIKYTDGTKGSSWVVKDTDTKVFEKGFALHKNESGTAETVVSWGIKTGSITPTPASGSIAFSTEGDKNQLVATTLANGTYSMTIEATQNSKVVASMPFTVTSQDLAIDGEETLNFDNGLTANYTINTSHTVTWSISSWTPTTAGTAQPGIAAAATGNGAVVTLTNAQDPSGTLVIKATDNTYSSTQPLVAEKTITINKPEVNSSKVWTYDATNNWSSLDMDTACGTGDISITPAGGTATTVGRTIFNQQIVVGQKVTSIPNNFLDGCTAFNSEITFDTASECLIIGNDFLSGCTAFNQTFTIPASVQIIGDSFFNNCQAFNTAITIPATVTKVGNDFMYNCYAMIATITINTTAMAFEATGATPLTLACDDYSKACYATGMTIAGSDVANFKLLFPNITATATGYVCRNIL